MKIIVVSQTNMDRAERATYYATRRLPARESAYIEGAREVEVLVVGPDQMVWPEGYGGEYAIGAYYGFDAAGQGYRVAWPPIDGRATAYPVAY